MSANNNNFDQIQKAMNEIADGWDAKVVAGLFDYIGKLAVQEMQALAPVDTGRLKAGIKLTKSSTNTATIVSEAPYSVPVDQGHQTRGSTFVPANPFFSSVVGKYAGGELIKQARVKMKGHIEATLSHYRSR